MKPTTLHELSFGFTMAVSVGSRMMNIYEENLETCILCRTGAEKGDRYYIRTDVKSIAGDLLRKIPRYLAHLFDFLPMNSVSTSLVSKVPFCCRTGKKLLEKRQRQADNLAMVENDIRNRRKLGSSVRSLTFAEEINSLGPLACPLESSPMPSTREKPNLICDLSPIAVRPTTCTSLPDNNPLAPETEKLDEPPELGVKVVVTWPSQTKQRKLKKELEPLGKCLLQGTWMDIARAALRIKDLRTEMLKLILKEISKECCEIISTKSPSLLRKNSASDMQDLSLQKVCIELKARSPLLYSVMMTAAIPVRNQKHSLGSEKWLPSVAVAGSVLLKQRSRNMNAVQLMVTTLIKYTGFHAMCHFLSSLRIGVSPSYYNKKSDEFGQLFNNLMIQQKQEDEAVLKSCSNSATQSQSSPPTQNEKDANSIRQQEIEQSNQSSPPTSSKKGASGVHQQEVEQSNHSSPPTGTEKDASSVHQQEIRQFSQSSLPTLTEKDASSVHQQEIRQFNQSSPPTLQQEIGPGWKIAFNNLDIFQKVREMTEDNQNKDHHWINHVKVTNRVSGNHLPDDKPICDSVMDLDNYKIIPTVPQHISQRGNYILLIERVITEEIPCLSFCKDVVTMHIPHSHSKEMATKSEKECLGVIFEDESTTEGINRALHQFHSYVPLHSSQGGTVFNRVGVVGDQLSVERAVNCISSLANGFTPEERLDGLHVEIADWHAELKFLALIYQRFYSTVSANDKCTLFADRNSINRRNVKADAHHAYAPNKQMFLLAVKSRIVASAMKVLGLKQLDGSPTAYHYPRDESQHDKTMKRVYLRNLASQIVDKFIVDEKSYNLIVNHVLEDHDNERARQAQLTPDGRFPCREIGCNKTFRHDGQHRRNHERSAHGLIIEDPPESEEPLSSNSEESDDMFNYQCDLMDHGLLYMNFIDAVAEGDGDRIIRCWKFLLLHFYSDKGSTKYAIEALYLQLQQQALLSPRQAYRQRWNRGANNHSGSGKNVPLDLEVEHDNNAIKEGIRKLGPNLTRAAVSRCARMLPVARGTVHNVARECNLMKRSGKHFVKTTRNDLIKLVNQLVQENALTETPGRRYKHFKEFPRSPLRNLRMGKLCKWINKHKYELQIGCKAR